jgi:hypothetical protein
MDGWIEDLRLENITLAISSTFLWNGRSGLEQGDVGQVLSPVEAAVVLSLSSFISVARAFQIMEGLYELDTLSFTAEAHSRG